MTPHPTITSMFGDPPTFDTPQRLNNPVSLAFWKVCLYNTSSSGEF